MTISSLQVTLHQHRTISNCIKVGMNKHNQNLFFFRALILMLQPIILVLLAVVIWTLTYKLRARRVSNNKNLTDSIKYTSIIILYIFQIEAIKTTFLLFRYIGSNTLFIKSSCTNYGSTEYPLLCLAEDTQVECWTSKHLAWALGLGIPALLFCKSLA